MDDITVSGMDLKLQRVAADITARDLAAVMGCHPSRVNYIEGRRLVTPTAAEKYRAALATLTTKQSDAA